MNTGNEAVDAGDFVGGAGAAATVAVGDGARSFGRSTQPPTVAAGLPGSQVQVPFGSV